MTRLRYAELARKPMDVLDMTSLTPDEFQLLVPAVETAFQAHMALWRLDGKPRTARRFTVYKNCPLPTPEDRLLFVLVYLKTNPLQVAHGILFGLPQGKANQWIHVLLPVLRTALRQLGDVTRRVIQRHADAFWLVHHPSSFISHPSGDTNPPGNTRRTTASGWPASPCR